MPELIMTNWGRFRVMWEKWKVTIKSVDEKNKRRVRCISLCGRNSILKVEREQSEHGNWDLKGGCLGAQQSETVPLCKLRESVLLFLMLQTWQLVKSSRKWSEALTSFLLQSKPVSGKLFSNNLSGFSVTPRVLLMHTHICLYSILASPLVPLVLLEFHTSFSESTHPPSGHK